MLAIKQLNNTNNTKEMLSGSNSWWCTKLLITAKKHYLFEKDFLSIWHPQSTIAQNFTYSWLLTTD